jgi:RecA/RadA recombinase
MQTTAAARPLTEVLEALQAKGLGLRKGVGPMPGVPLVDVPPVPTGHARLDEALRTDGWPRGSLALLDAPIGSGATSLALATLSACQSAGGLVAWLDLEGSFDPSTAARAGVSLEWLLIARPRDPVEAVELAAWLARTRLLDVLVLDLGLQSVPSRAVTRLPDLLARFGGVVLTLAAAPSAREVIGRVAGIRVELDRVAWLAVGRDLVGERVRAHVARHRWALAGASADLDLWFTEGRRIDPLLPSLAMPAGPYSLVHLPVDERPDPRVLSA